MNEAAKDIVCGGFAGSLAKIIEFPFDTVKVRLQSNPSFSSRSSFYVIKYTLQNEGLINGFYKGLKAPMIGAFLESAVLFVAYNSATTAIANTTNKDKSNLPLWIQCTGGAISGLLASFVLSPVELVKCKLQVSNLHAKQTHSYLSIMKNILRNDGVFGFWRGLSSTILRESAGTAIWFGTYEVTSDYLLRKNPQHSTVNLLSSGALAGVLFNFSMFPVDTIKSNIQTYDMLHDLGKTPTFWKAAKTLYGQTGLRSFYHGVGITLVRAVPANALIFYVYEVLKKFWEKYEKREKR